LRASSELVTEVRTATARFFDIGTNIFFLSLFNRAQVGLGLTQRLGHAYYSLSADTLFIDYQKRGVLNMRGDLEISASGMNKNGSFNFNKLNGYGLSLSAGADLLNDQFSLSVYLKDAGFMSWHRMNSLTKVHVSKDSVFLADIFNSDNDSMLTTERFSPERIRYQLTPLLTGIAGIRIPVSRQFHFISSYQLFSCALQAPLSSKGPFNKETLLSLNVENGFDYGKIPIRLGWTYRADREISSSISVELLNHHLAWDIWYRAIGDWIFRSRKGAEVGFCFHIYPGLERQ
jgi:hypothetical protein